MTEENKTKIKTENESHPAQTEKSPTILNLFIIIFFVVLTVAYHKGYFSEQGTSFAETMEDEQSPSDAAKIQENKNWATHHISKQARIHILYGDETGGAHFHTVKRPCKAIFPKSWSADKIINVTEEIAANDNLEWRTFKNGNKYTQEEHDGVLVRVVMNPDRIYVKTSYPLNAKRTPCPRDEKINDNKESEDKELEESKTLDDTSKIKHKYEYNH